MAYRATKSGFAADADRKLQAKYEPEVARVCVEWVSEVIGEKLDHNDGDKEQFHELLKDGQILCKLANALKPGSVKKVSSGKMAFHWMGNLEAFINVAKELGVPDQETFQTTELVEGTNLYAVLCCLSALGRKAHDIPGVQGLGPKEARENKRDFSEDKLKAGQTVIGLQMGSNKGATQSGQNFGLQRKM